MENSLLWVERYRPSTIDDCILSDTIKNGAIIIVPTIRETIALDGDVAKPGIYEIKDNDENLEDFLDMTGSLKLPKKLLIDRQKIGNEGFDEIEFGINKNTTLNNGDIFIAKSRCLRACS